MSGITGIVLFDGQQVSSKTLTTMTNAIAHRGPDRINTWNIKNAGLAHCMLHTTPQSLHEHLPFYDSTKQLVIVSDARIDNRQELAQKLNLSQFDTLHLADSKIILLAYEKWGFNCAAKLRGDFSFAIWDVNNQHIFCARDHLGVKPFHYHYENKQFSFGSEIKSILANNNVVARPNIERIADFLTCIVSDQASTFYQNINRLPAGSYLLCNQHGLQIHKYWHLTFNGYSDGPETIDIEKLQSIIQESVTNRMRSSFPIGSNLSGGLDSSTIVSQAAKLLQKAKQDSQNKIYTFSGIFNQITQCDEQIYIQAVTDKYSKYINHTNIVVDEIKPGNCFDEMVSFSDEPFFAPHFFMTYKIAQQATKQNIRFFMDGHDGDSAISHGYGLFPELLKRMKFLTAYYEAVKLSGNKKRSVRRLLKLEQSILCNYLFKTRLNRENTVAPTTILNDSFVEQSSINYRLQQLTEYQRIPTDDEWQQQLKALSSPIQQYTLEFLNTLGTKHGIELVFPFTDFRILECCLHIKPEIKLHDGLNRYILRLAMSKTIPSKVFYRKHKTDFTSSALHAYRNDNDCWLTHAISNLPTSIFSFIDKKTLEVNVEHFSNLQSAESLYLLLRVISLGKWLSKNSFT